MPRAILVILDGLRRDLVTPQTTPRLATFAERSEQFAAHRTVFPSCTRVVSASLATGCHPARHGLQGNTMALMENGRLVRHDAGRPDFLQHKRRVTGRALAVPTLAERLTDSGGAIIFSNVSPGAAYAHDPDGFGRVYHRAGSFGRDRVPLPEDEQLRVTLDVAGDRAMTERFIREAVLPSDPPALAVLWLGEPDATQHALPMGSPGHLAVLEEADRNDPLIPLQKDFKAFNYYHLPNGNAVGLWKYALTSITKDEGKTWQYGPLRAPGFVNANAKIWGQKTSDKKYATVYNPSEFRWPLALSVSDDGLNYKNLLLVNGEISSLRYGGAYKSYGPQYVRGIQEMDGVVPGGNMWVVYSMNKEDIWISEIPVPVRDKVTADVNDEFNNKKDGEELKEWNIFSPIWCKVAIEKNDNAKTLVLHDSDPFDHAKAERIFPVAKKLSVSFAITAQQINTGELEIEMVDAKGTPCLRLMLDSTGSILTKQGYRNKSLGKYKVGETIDIKIELNTTTRFYNVTINGGKPSNNLCFAPVESVERIVFRTGTVRRFPDADTPTDQDYDLPDPNRKDKEAVYWIHYLKTKIL